MKPIVIIILLILSSCIPLSNRDYVQEHSAYRGTRKIVIFLQRWPCYLQKPLQSDLGVQYISKKTVFYGSWEPAGRIIAFAENSFLNEGKWVSRESFQGAGFLIVSVPIHDP